MLKPLAYLLSFVCLFFYPLLFSLKSWLNYCHGEIDAALGFLLLNATTFPRHSGKLTFLLELIFIMIVDY